MLSMGVSDIICNTNNQYSTKKIHHTIATFECTASTQDQMMWSLMTDRQEDPSKKRETYVETFRSMKREKSQLIDCLHNVLSERDKTIIYLESCLEEQIEENLYLKEVVKNDRLYQEKHETYAKFLWTKKDLGFDKINMSYSPNDECIFHDRMFSEESSSEKDYEAILYQLKSELDSLKKDLESMERDREELQQELTIYKSENAELEYQCNKYKEQIKTPMPYEIYIQEHRDSQLKELTEKLKQLKRKNFSMKQTIHRKHRKEMNNKGIQFKECIAKIQTQSQEKISGLEQELTEQKDNVKRYEYEIQNLEDKLEKTETRSFEKLKEDYERQDICLAKVREDVATYQLTCDDYKRELEKEHLRIKQLSVEHNNELSEYRQKMQDLAFELQEVKTKFSEAEKMKNADDKLHHHDHDKVIELQKRVTEYEKTEQVQKHKLEHALSEIEEQKEISNKMHVKYDQCQKEITDLIKNKACEEGFRNKIEKNHQQKLTLQEQKYESEIQKLKDDLEKSKEIYWCDSEKWKEYERQLLEKDKCLAKVKEDVSEYQVRYESEIQKLKDELEKSKVIYIHDSEKLKECHEKQILEQNNCLAKMREDVSEYQVRSESYKKEMENEHLKNEQLAVEYNKEILEYKQGLDSLKAQFSNKLIEAESKIRKLMEENTLLTETFNGAKAYENIISEKNKKIEQLSSRLAAEMSCKISSDERSLENVSVRNRPMNIASDYEMICSSEWHDAKVALDELVDGLSQEDKINFLGTILEVSEFKASQFFNEFMVTLGNMIIQPFEGLSHQQSLPAENIPSQMKVLVGDHLRGNVDSTDINKIIQTVQVCAVQNQPDTITGLIEQKQVTAYIDASVKLAWKMVLQRPPMCFKQEGIGEKWQGEKKQELFWSSSDPNDPKSRVKYYVHPTLYHGETLMVKGRVFLSNQ